MPQQIFGAEAVVSMVNRALANTSPANTVFQNQVAAAGTTEASQYAFAAQLGAQYAVGKTPAELSALLLGNMGVANEVLESALTDYIAFHGAQNIGVIALQLSQIVSGLEGDATFGAAAAAWNQEVTNAYQYSSSPNNNTPQTGDDGASSTKLSRFTDVATGHEFTGYLDYNQFTGKDEQTLTDSDRLTGTDATDDLLFAQLGGVAVGATATARPTLNGIETVSIDAKADLAELNLADANGVKTIINTRSNETSTLTFSNLKNLVDVVVRGTNGNTDVKFNGSVVAGTADALNLTVDGAGVKAKAANFEVNGIETLNIAATGNASVLGTVTAAEVKAVTITGDQNLTVGTKTATGFTGDKIETVDGSAATGNLFLNLTASAARDQTVKTGTGADVVVTGKLSATDTFDLGAGNDRLVLATGNNASQEAAKLIGVEEVETREVGARLNLTNAADVKVLAVADLGNVVGTAPGQYGNTAAAIDASAGFANVTAVKSGTAVVFEGRGLANGASSSKVYFGDVTYNLANATGTSDVIDFKFNNAGVTLGANSTLDIGKLVNTGNNVETINLAFSDLAATSKVTVAAITDSALKTLTVTADGKVDLGVYNAGAKTGVNSTALTSVDATGVKNGFTAKFEPLAASANATIKLGGAGVNELTVTKANDAAATAHKVLTVDASAGTGNQKITILGNTDVDSNADTSTATKAAASASVIVIGGAGNDTIDLSAGTGAFDADSVNWVKGGAGADTIKLSSGIDILVFAAGDSTSASTDQITSFTAGTDKIDLSSFGFDSELTKAITSASLTGQAGEFTGNALAFAANTLYVDVNGDNKLDVNDLVIKLDGVASLATTDFLFA